MIELINVSKTFGHTEVLHDISIVFEPGKIYGLSGRNGSGKTMLMRMILGFVRPTSGTVKVDGKIIGKDIELAQNIGAIIESPGFLPEFSGYETSRDDPGSDWRG